MWMGLVVDTAREKSHPRCSLCGRGHCWERAEMPESQPGELHWWRKTLVIQEMPLNGFPFLV